MKITVVQTTRFAMEIEIPDIMGESFAITKMKMQPIGNSEGSIQTYGDLSEVAHQVSYEILVPSSKRA